MGSTHVCISADATHPVH